MKKIMMLLAVVLFSCSAIAQSIVVFDFKTTDSVPEAFSDSVTSVFMSNFHPKGYVVVDSLKVNECIVNQGFDKKDLNKQQYIETGKILNVQKIVIGEIDHVEENFVVTASLINVETTATETMLKATISDISVYENKISALAQKIVEKLDKPEDDDRNRTRPRAFTVNGVRFIVQYVKGGTFMMGATPEQEKSAYNVEKPAHEVTLNDFYIGKYEVTQDLWIAVMGEDPEIIRAWNRYGRGDNYPAYMVSWDDCKVFIEKLNKITGAKFRLPTEAEWEYAARGGVKSKKYKFSGSNNVNDVAWYNRTIVGYGPMPVGMKLPNELGIYDMSGNVWEWCEDWFGKYSEEHQKNPKGKPSGVNHVLRGGSWSRSSRLSRISNRGYNRADARYNYNGFRLVVEPKTK